METFVLDALADASEFSTKTSPRGYGLMDRHRAWKRPGKQRGVPRRSSPREHRGTGACPQCLGVSETDRIRIRLSERRE